MKEYMPAPVFILETFLEKQKIASVSGAAFSSFELESKQWSSITVQLLKLHAKLVFDFTSPRAALSSNLIFLLLYVVGISLHDEVGV